MPNQYYIVSPRGEFKLTFCKTRVCNLFHVCRRAVAGFRAPLPFPPIPSTPRGPFLVGEEKLQHFPLSAGKATQSSAFKG